MYSKDNTGSNPSRKGFTDTGRGDKRTAALRREHIVRLMEGRKPEPPPLACARSERGTGAAGRMAAHRRRVAAGLSLWTIETDVMSKLGESLRVSAVEETCGIA
jgi:hypothetical protein